VRQWFGLRTGIGTYVRGAFDYVLRADASEDRAVYDRLTPSWCDAEVAQLLRFRSVRKNAAASRSETHTAREVRRHWLVDNGVCVKRSCAGSDRRKREVRVFTSHSACNFAFFTLRFPLDSSDGVWSDGALAAALSASGSAASTPRVRFAAGSAAAEASYPPNS